MRSSNMQIAKDFDPKLNSKRLAVQFMQQPLNANIVTFTPENESQTRLLRVEVLTGVRFVEVDQIDGSDDEVISAPQDDVEPHVKAELKATFIAEYALTCDDLSQDAINEFSKKNAGFHIWPYWREYLHTTCSRCNLPPVVVPMYQITNNP